MGAPRWPRWLLMSALSASVTLAALCAPSLAANASDVSLKATLATWSHRIGVDARAVGASAANRHPRRMTTRARHFRVEALRARRAILSQRPSSATGRAAKRLGLAAFREYGLVGREWMLSGQARLGHHRAAATVHARRAGRLARAASRTLVRAGALLR